MLVHVERTLRLVPAVAELLRDAEAVGETPSGRRGLHPGPALGDGGKAGIGVCGAFESEGMI